MMVYSQQSKRATTSGQTYSVSHNTQPLHSIYHVRWILSVFATNGMAIRRKAIVYLTRSTHYIYTHVSI